VSSYARYGKRIVDVIIASVALVVLSPLWMLIMLAYTVSFSFPVFYRQERIGRGKELFSLWKFRTLLNKPGTLQQRRFMLGDLMRFTSLDELPQLVNVLNGNMSCVGPRPLPKEYLHLFSPEQQRRHLVRPGITGWAQVNGRNSISWQDKLAHDVYYVNHVSFGLDLFILFKTIVILFSFKKDVSLQEEKFTGTN